MKILLFACIVFMRLISCNHATKGNEAFLQNQLDRLKSQLGETYKPGLGEFMSSIQIHHAKLWFAGKNENWDLADFEIHEIMESIDDIKKYATDRKETKSIDMIFPGIDSLSNAIVDKNYSRFRSSFELLTNSCNTCHKANDFGFNVVKTPDVPPFSNQRFGTK